jgi:hypothetical protein
MMERRRLAWIGCWGVLGAAAWACGGGSSASSQSAGDGGADASTGSSAGGSSGGGNGSSGSSSSGSTSSSSGSASSGGDASSDGSSSSSSSGASSGTGGDGGALATGSICPHVAAGDYEQYHLPATTGLPSGVTALTDWTQHPAHGGWYGAQQMDDCRYQADPRAFKTWHGKASARLEVNPGDDPLNLGANSERAECLTEQDATGVQFNESPSSGILYYATSYYFSASWAATSYPYSVFESGGSSWPGNVSSNCGGAGNLCNSWSLVLQLHGPGGGTPWAVLSAASTAPGQPQKMWLAGSNIVQFSDGGQIAAGRWVDLVIELDWGTAAITMWLRNEGQTAFAQVVSATFPAAVSGTYMKQGLYRGGNVNGRTDVLWVGPTARGSTFAAVEQAAFGTNVGP